ncbi:MAG: hypothetical protein ACXAE3_00545 [Candidatus Kariarchaeaceae archaeon]|jgi:methylase of polypeptide subunit release factors
MVDIRSLRKLGKKIPVDNFDHVYHGLELLLCKAILEDIKEHTPLDDYFRSGNLLAFARKVDDLEIEKPDLELDPHSETLGELLQQALLRSDRKTLASNYTGGSFQLLRRLIKQQGDRIIDHFCGTGNLIVGYLQVAEEASWEFPTEIRLNDLMPTAVLIAYWRVKSIAPEVTTIATIGDGFSVEGVYDLALINPPYTRSHRISDSIRKGLESLDIDTSHTGQAGLHYWATLLLHHLLTPDGQALVVLPRATLNARYSLSLKRVLLKQFGSLRFIQDRSRKAFSQGSELRELILQLRKGNEISFCELTPELKVVNTCDHRIIEQWNWGRYFLPEETLALSDQIVQGFRTGSREERDITIRRGIEMYGPDEFFLPSKLVSLQINGEIARLQLEENTHDLNVALLRPILRQPKLYKNRITPEVEEYVIMAEYEDLPAYFEAIRERVPQAIRKFGDRWFAHPKDQVSTKGLSGQIFIVDKLDVTRTPTLAYYTDSPYLCTKNFYELSVEDETYLKLLGAWMNSTWYFLLYLAHRREIGGTYGRLQIVDYSHHSLFIPSKEDTQRVSQAFDKLRFADVDVLPEQHRQEAQQQLDMELADLFGVDISLDHLYSAVELTISHLSKVSRKN